MGYTRVAYSPLGTSMRRAIITLGKGDWEISSLSVIMGGKLPALNGAEHGGGYVAFEILDAAKNVKESHFLLAGRCTSFIPLVIDSPKRVTGPGRIRSSIRHGQSSEHTLTAIYRRVKE